MGKFVLALACALAACTALAQAYKPTPVNRCDYLTALRVGPERSAAGLLPNELVENLAEARAVCEQAVKDQPKAARLHTSLARVLAIAGDAAGALASARTGADLGSPGAQVLLGVMLAQGKHAGRDLAAARELFARAAKAGHPYGYFNLGVLEQDAAEAAVALRQAAKGGDPLASQLVAQRYDKSDELLKKAAEAMYPDAGANPLRVGFEMDSAALLAWYEEKARAGEPWAQAYLGALHEAGQWVRQDYAAAAAWYRRSGEQRHVPAQWRLARLYRDGRGVPKDAAEARRWSLMWQVQRCEEHELAETGADACDRLAAERYDPLRAAAGVDSFCMRHFAERAVAACTAATRRSPSTVRFRTQLARSLAHTGNFPEARREARAAAASGSTAAMILLGVMSQRGLGVPEDGKDALAWYRKAAGAGDARAVSLVTTSAFNGVGVAKDSPEAKALLEEMRNRAFAAPAVSTPATQAERGDVRAQHNLAAQFELEKNYAEALKWYERAAAKGFRPSALNLAQMYEQGMGVKRDTGEARRRYRGLADEGDGEALYRAAKLAAAEGDYSEALKLYERGVRADDTRAILDLGEIHEHGRGVPGDTRRAIALYEKAADRSPWARFKLGVLYFQGKNYARARQWLERSAADGNAGARNNLGWMHEKGLGTKADPAAAREHYLAALRGGSAHAKGNLENFYARGAHSLDDYRVGAEAGIASAQYRLGMMVLKSDEEAAAKWLLKAAEQGHQEARKEAAELFYRKGNYEQATALGHEGAMKKYAEQLAAKAGKPEVAGQIHLFMKSRYRAPPAFPSVSGVATDQDKDFARTVALRVASVATAHAATVDAAIANVYDIIRWFPETDGKK